MSADIQNTENPAISADAVTGFITAPDWTISVDGKNVTAVAPFDDGTTDEIETTPGMLGAICS
jgi:hypothetical protein